MQFELSAETFQRSQDGFWKEPNPSNMLESV